MLIGEFKHNLDPKGRITIPSKFREDLSVFVMTKGLDDCLFLYPKEQWEKIENKLKELNYDSIRVDTHKDNKSMLRFIEKNGFQKCGIVYIRKTDERIAFEKPLK